MSARAVCREPWPTTTVIMFDVYLYDQRIGTLEGRGRGIRFTYGAEALDDPRMPALSLALPKQAESFPDSQAGPFFRNLLPEQAYRRLIAAAARTAPDNALALLGAIGAECPGAVSIWPEGTGPTEHPEYQPLGIDELRALFAVANAGGLADAMARGRLSLPGVQEKIALMQQNDGGWLLPRNGAITSHILKEAPPAFPQLLENELFCMALAMDAGLSVATTGLAAPSIRVFCAERFDRISTGARTGPTHRKIHQEDFCQILSVDPERKYESDGGPGLRQCARVIREHAALPARDLERLTRWTAFNYLIGNEDAHAKNLALVYREDGLALSPHYDLVSTEVYPGLQRSLAMKIGGASDIRNVQRSNWERFARALGLPFDQVRSWTLDQARRVRDVLDATVTRCGAGYGKAAVYAEIAELCARRVTTLLLPSSSSYSASPDILS